VDADGQLAGTPSVIFDAVAIILTDAAGKQLATDGAAVDYVRNAFGHLKAIALDGGAQPLAKASGVVPDAGVVDVSDVKAFMKAAKTRQWEREKKVRLLA
jgi:catalase